MLLSYAIIAELTEQNLPLQHCTLIKKAHGLKFCGACALSNKWQVFNNNFNKTTENFKIRKIGQYKCKCIKEQSLATKE